MHKRRSDLPSPQPLARSKLSSAQSVFTAFSSQRRRDRFIFIYFRERVGYWPSIRVPIRAMTRYRGRGSSIGRARHFDLPSARTTIGLLKQFFVQSTVTSKWAMQPTRVYEVRPRSDKRGVDLISDVLPFGRLWYGDPNAISNAIGYAKFYSRSHDAVIRVYDDAGNVIETHDHTGPCIFLRN
jgi:hypothetical protein